MAWSDPLVSVLMPAYNHARFIGDAIGSVQAQGYKRWEVIVVDDGSTDGTADIAREAGVRVVVQEHAGPQGLAATYNRALFLAKGELIAVLEGDDFWPGNKLEIQVRDFRDERVVLSFGNYIWTDANGRPVHSFVPPLPPEALSNDPVGTATWHMAGLAQRTFMFPCTVVLRRSVLKEFRGLPGPVNLVDFPTFLDISTRGTFAYHDIVLGFWRRHPGSLTAMYQEPVAKRMFEHAVDFLREHPEYRRDGDVEALWRRTLGHDCLANARSRLVAGRRREASALFRRAAAETALPTPLRAVALFGQVAAAFGTDLEPIWRTFRGYDLRSLSTQIDQK